MNLSRIAAWIYIAAMVGPAASALADDPPLPALTGRVVDQAEILSPSIEATISNRLETYEKATTNQIVVVTLPDLMGRPIEDWGLMLGRGWGVGQAGRDNGIVFLIAPNARELRIEVGYGLEGDLSDATADSIIRNDIIPHFKSGDMEAGIVAGVDAIIATLDKTYVTGLAKSSADGLQWWEWVDKYANFVLFGGVFLFVFFGRWRRRWNPVSKRYQWAFVPSSGSGGRSGRGGGGFSGGGGSFGGGGASGRW